MRTIALLFFALSTHAQLPNWEWAHQVTPTHGYYGHRGIRTAVDRFGNFFVLALTKADPASFPTYFLAKYDTYGALSWTVSLENQMNDLGVDHDGNAIVGGNIITSDSDSTCLIIQKFHHDGAKIWERKYAGGYSELRALSVGPSGDIYFTGTQGLPINFGSNIPNDGSRVFITKLSSDGNIVWAKTSSVFPPHTPVLTPAYSSCIATDLEENIYLASQGTNMANSCMNCPSFPVISVFSKGGQLLKNYVHPQDDGSAVELYIDEKKEIYLTHTSDVWTSGGIMNVSKLTNALELEWTTETGYWQGGDRMMSSRVVGKDANSVLVAGSVGKHPNEGESADSIKVGNQRLPIAGKRDLIIAQLDRSTGAITGIYHEGTIYSEEIHGISADQFGNCYVAGIFNHTRNSSDPSDSLRLNNSSLYMNGLSTQLFVAKLKFSEKPFTDKVGLPKWSVNECRSYSAGPSNITIEISEGSDLLAVRIFTLDGRKIFQSSEPASGFISVRPPTAGIYLVQSINDKSVKCTKLLVR